MYKLTDEETRFKVYLESLEREFHNAYYHFVIYNQLEIFRGEYQNELREASEFWGLTQRAHFFDVIMRLNKICDDDMETINIHMLLDYAEQHLHLFAEESFARRKGYSRDQSLPKINKRLLSEQRQKYITFSSTNLRKLRNRVLAHIDKGVIINDIWPFQKWAVDSTQIKTIIDQINETLNLLSLSFDSSKYINNSTHLEQSMSNTMDLIRIGLKEKGD